MKRGCVCVDEEFARGGADSRTSEPTEIAESVSVSARLLRKKRDSSGIGI